MKTEYTVNAAHTSRLCAAFIRILVFLTVSFICAAAICTECSAESLTDPGLWQGEPVHIIEDKNVIYLENSGSAYITLDAENMASFFICCDAGNYAGKGTGSITVQCMNDAGETVFTFEGGAVSDDGRFRHYTLGNDDMFAGLPENTASVRVILVSNSQGDGPYFRDLSAVFSSTSAYDTSISEWSVSESVGLVEVKVTRADYWVMVLFVSAVAFIMYGVKVYLDKVKSKKL